MITTNGFKPGNQFGQGNDNTPRYGLSVGKKKVLLSLGQDMHDDLVKIVKTQHYSSLSELIREGMRNILRDNKHLLDGGQEKLIG